MSEGRASIGSCLAFAAGAPATHDQTGFEAMSWSSSGEETNIGALGGTVEVIKYTTVCDGKTHKRMGADDSGQQSNSFAYDSDNAAQILIKAAKDGKTVLSVRETLPNGDVIYYKSYVPSFVITPGGSSDYLKLDVVTEIDEDLVTVLA